MKLLNVFQPPDTAVLPVEKPETLSPRKKQAAHLGVLLSQLPGRAANISVPINDGLQMVSTEDIVTCLAQESSTEIVLTNGLKYTVPRILKEYETMLAGLNFFRIHHSCLINLKHVKKYVKGDGGYVLMSDGQCCEVSRRKKTILLNRLTVVPL